jgi:hypothetical protein
MHWLIICCSKFLCSIILSPKPSQFKYFGERLGFPAAMESSSNSSRPTISLESVNSEAPLLADLIKKLDGALASPAERLNVFSAVPDELGELQVVVAPKYLENRSPLAPQVSVLPETTWVDDFYNKRFQHLELELALKYPHVPASVIEGNVATVSLVSVSPGGGAVIESVLEKHVAGSSK